MKRTSFKFFTIAIIAMVFLSSCERVAPNYAGVLRKITGNKGRRISRSYRAGFQLGNGARNYFKSRYSTNEASSEALSR